MRLILIRHLFDTGSFTLYSNILFYHPDFSRMDKKDVIDGRYSEYTALDGRHQRLKVRREMELTAPARPRLASSSSYPSSSSATSSSRDSATQFSHRRTQNITQV